VPRGCPLQLNLTWELQLVLLPLCFDIRVTVTVVAAVVGTVRRVLYGKSTCHVFAGGVPSFQGGGLNPNNEEDAEAMLGAGRLGTSAPDAWPCCIRLGPRKQKLIACAGRLCEVPGCERVRRRHQPVPGHRIGHVKCREPFGAFFRGYCAWLSLTIGALVCFALCRSGVCAGV